MDRQVQPGWRIVGDVDPRDLAEARLQLHWAVQPVMAFADCALDHLPDDSQANLGWRDDFEALVGRPRPDGLSAGLRIPDMTLLVFDEKGTIAEGVSLEGRTIESSLSWLEDVVTSRTGVPPGRRIRVRDYEMPEHAVAEGATFDIANPPAIRELARWFADGDTALTKLTSSDEGWAEVRCWPHHFDLGTLRYLELNSKSIGAGLSPGDSWYPEPYFYVNPYGLADVPAAQPALESGGHWHTAGWFGAVLPASQIVKNSDRAQEPAVSLFLRGAVGAARELLGDQRS